jgi:hypothetical protein
MPAGPTYVALKSTTLASSQTAVEFDSFSGYSDLFLIINALSVSTTNNMDLRFNGDSGSNYARVVITSASGVTGFGQYDQTAARVTADGIVRNVYSVHGIHINNYASTAVYKNVLSRANDIDTGVDIVCAYWRNLNAITSMSLTLTGSNFGVGSKFTLYGIKRA